MHKVLVASLALACSFAPSIALADDPPPVAAAVETAAPPAAMPPAATEPAATPPVTPAEAPARASAAPRAHRRAVAKRKWTGPMATYPSFQVLSGGGSRVTVDIDGKLDVADRKAEGRLVYRLKGVQTPIRTNRLPLLTTYFRTVIARVELVNQDGDVDLVIELQEPSAPSFQIVDLGGRIRLQVDFPPPRSAAEKAAPVVAAASDDPGADTQR